VENVKQFEKVTTLNCFLGDCDKIISGKATHTEGTLKIDLSNATSEINIRTIDALYSEQNSLFSSVKLYKIDTDGFDYKILIGSKRFLTKLKPVIFFEYSEKHLRDAGDDAITLFTYLEALGYTMFVFYDPYGRFMFSSLSSNIDLIKQIHAYISNYSLPLCYLDISAFHQEDKDVFLMHIEEEENYNLKGKNSIIENKV
jgi:hypothetical protein